eukprot:COSAG04_NODE_164_length_21771_cov_415.923219_15_plen_304_part_00
MTEVKAAFELVRPKLRPHQRMMLVPGIFGSHHAPPVCNATLAETSKELVTKLDAYMAWAREEPLIAGFCPWHLLNRSVDQNWKPGCDQEVGAVAMPAVMAKLREMGEAILHPKTARLKLDDSALLEGRSKGYSGWAGLVGGNYVPSYPVVNGSFGYGILGIFKSQYWNATTVGREIGWAKRLNITALRVFVCMRGREEDPDPDRWLSNYQEFQRMMRALSLRLMVTFWWADPFSCANATSYLHDVVAAEVPGVVLSYEAANDRLVCGCLRSTSGSATGRSTAAPSVTARRWRRFRPRQSQPTT